MIRFFAVLFTMAMMVLPSFAQKTNSNISHNINYSNNKAPLIIKPYIELPLGTIKPHGWLREQLSRMVTGMTGHMDEIYEPVMGSRNGWLGGDGDVWERGPYWIDGLLPLAYILDDNALKEKVKPWIEWTLASQKENGYFGPDTDRGYEPGLQRGNSHDWWPKMVMLKVLQQHYSATKDERVISFMTNYFKYQLQELPKTPLGNWTFWAEQRGGDNLLIVYWLYNITGDKFLLELGDLIHEQSTNWTNIFNHDNHLYREHSLHCVNLAQGFKEPIVYYQRSGDAENLNAVYNATKTIRHSIGLPTGLWAGDELLAFGDPTKGSELCTAAEMMYSLENILEITGDMKWGDYLERVTYNSLPTQISDDFGSRQYYQQLNQIAVTNETRTFSTPHEGTDNLFGVLTGYPCCTSNLHQSWPKFTQHLWYATADNGLAALVFGPSEVNAIVADNVSVKVLQETSYPFDEKISFKFSYNDKKTKEAFFPFHVRIPDWSAKPTIKLNGKLLQEPVINDNILIVNRKWKENDVLEVEFPAEVKVERWYSNSAVVERGPLLYALKLNEKWNKKEFHTEKEKKEYGPWYYEVTTDSKWNYALKENHIKPENIKNHFIVEKNTQLAKYPWTWADAPITIKAKGRIMPRWKEVNGSTAPIAYYVQQYDFPEAEELDIELIPYGCTTLRITEFPVRR